MPSSTLGRKGIKPSFFSLTLSLSLCVCVCVCLLVRLQLYIIILYPNLVSTSLDDHQDHSNKTNSHSQQQFSMRSKVISAVLFVALPKSANVFVTCSGNNQNALRWILPDQHSQVLQPASTSSIVYLLNAAASRRLHLADNQYAMVWRPSVCCVMAKNSMHGHGKTGGLSVARG